MKLFLSASTLAALSMSSDAFVVNQKAAPKVSAATALDAAKDGNNLASAAAGAVAGLTLAAQMAFAAPATTVSGTPPPPVENNSPTTTNLVMASTGAYKPEAAYSKSMNNMNMPRYNVENSDELLEDAQDKFEQTQPMFGKNQNNNLKNDEVMKNRDYLKNTNSNNFVAKNNKQNDEKEFFGFNRKDQQAITSTLIFGSFDGVKDNTKQDVPMQQKNKNTNFAKRDMNLASNIDKNAKNGDYDFTNAVKKHEMKLNRDFKTNVDTKRMQAMGNKNNINKDATELNRDMKTTDAKRMQAMNNDKDVNTNPVDEYDLSTTSYKSKQQQDLFNNRRAGKTTIDTKRMQAKANTLTAEDGDDDITVSSTVDNMKRMYGFSN